MSRSYGDLPPFGLLDRVDPRGAATYARSAARAAPDQSALCVNAILYTQERRA
jgi:hypothetical protein